MSQVTMFSCDLCKAEYRDAPNPTQQEAAIIQIPGFGPVDQPLGNTIKRKWDDLCPDCTKQLRDATAKIIEARKGHLNVTVNDSTRSPKTEEIERAKKDATEEEKARGDARVSKAEKAGAMVEQNRVVKIIEDQIAGHESVITLRKSEGDDEAAISSERYINILKQTLKTVTQK